MKIKPDPLRTWATQVLAQVNVREEDAALIARCLVDVDLRGIVSHGTRQLRRYVPEFRDGLVNTHPDIRIQRTTESTIRLDGDGGAGYLVATQAVDAACDKALENGLAMATTCNHGHVGSEGIYARRAVERGLVSWCVAGGADWGKPKEEDATIWDAMKAPPICFGIPSDDGPPLVADMNASFFNGRDQAEAALPDFPKAVFASLGIKFVSTLLGGILSGAVEKAERRYKGASRGFMFVAINPEEIGDAEAFKQDVTRIMQASLELRPIAGTESAELPGTREWKRERDWAIGGIPIPQIHLDLLTNIANELGIPLPEGNL
ncbi:MAG: Ldh family oxidoreductase [Candidatus Latescibacterota bacterium]|nr:Ldh family oxidoreductase [Candidatus Latescibacterota bacterium]